MLVKERMTHPVITVNPDMPMQEALNLMRTEKISRLPVVDAQGTLIGIVSEPDLLHASPSDVSALSVHELTYLLSKITIDEIMVKDVVTSAEDVPIETAARIMVDNGISGLPVVRDGKVVGIITQTDLFKIFLELMGARDAGVRLSAYVPNRPGELAKLTTAVFEKGGNIMALVQFLGESSQNREIVMKVDGIDPQELEATVVPFVEKVIEVRESDIV